MIDLKPFENQYNLIALTNSNKGSAQIPRIFSDPLTEDSSFDNLGLGNVLALAQEQLRLGLGNLEVDGNLPIILLLVLAPQINTRPEKIALAKGTQTPLLSEKLPLVTALSPSTDKRDYGGLSRRERQVAALIAGGKSNREIASEMIVGVKTIETYITRILNKLTMNSRTQVAVWAVEKGLVQNVNH